MTRRVIFLGIYLFGFWLPSAGLAQQVTGEFVAESERVFGRPHDIVLGPDSRYLFVSDLGNDAVKVLDPETLTTVGTIGADELASPHDVAFDSAGRLLVADTANNRIAVYEVDGASGTLVASWHARMRSPEGVVATPDGRVYVANASAHTVVMLVDGQATAMVGERGSQDNQYARPHDLDRGPDGHLYVTDPGNDRIQILTDTLDHVANLGGDGYDFDEPKYLALDAAGRLYVADEYNNQIKIFDPAHKLIGTVGSGDQGDGPYQFHWPEGVTVLGDRMWVADTRNGRIVLYRLHGLDG